MSIKHHVTSEGLLVLAENDQIQSSVCLWMHVQLRVSSAMIAFQSAQRSNCCCGLNMHDELTAGHLPNAQGPS